MGGSVEEVWSPPAACQMVGHFRLIVDGRAVVYELMLLDVVEAGLRMRVKHVSDSFVGWEERDEWQEFSPQTATRSSLNFHGLTMRQTSESTMEIEISLERGGETTEHLLQLRRAPL
jgi:hypothetical protein